MKSSPFFNYFLFRDIKIPLLPRGNLPELIGNNLLSIRDSKFISPNKNAIFATDKINGISNLSKTNNYEND